MGRTQPAYLATPLGGGLSASLTGGLHRQSTNDLDGGGWIDILGYDRWTARRRLFWQSPGGFDLFLTGGAMHEDRRGGTMPGSTVPDGTPFPLSQHSERYDTGLIAKAPTGALEHPATHYRAETGGSFMERVQQVM